MENITKNAKELTFKEKYDWFIKLKPTVIFAIKRAYLKFDSIPLEIQDFEFYAWEAFEELLKIYYERNMKKSFTSCLVDAVYWKTLNVCTKYVTNKFKVVNDCMRSAAFLNDDYNFNKNYKDYNQLFMVENIGWTQILERYFALKDDQLCKEIFHEYLYGTKISEISRNKDISISKTKSILNKTIKDLKKIITQSAF